MADTAWFDKQAQARFVDILKQEWPDEIRFGAGIAPRSWGDTFKQFNIPIRTRTPWDDAVKWLETRAAADVEWPWPKWEDYRAR